MIELKIRKETAGGRIDKYLFHFLDKAPRSFVYKMMRKKNIVLNGKKIAGNEILKEGDQIRIFFAAETLEKFHSEKKPADQMKTQIETESGVSSFEALILYEDRNLIALNKPCGMLSQKASGNDVSINERMVSYLSRTSSSEEGFVPGISNRLDRNTSGIILAGKNPAASRQLNLAIKERQLSKQYLTLVSGSVRGENRISGYLVKEEASNKVQIYTAPKDASGQKAAYIETVYRPLYADERLSLLEVDLITGKSHQIRAHLASAGHPVIGDDKYGDRKLNRSFYEQYGLDAQFLHAGKITFCRMEGILAYLNGRVISAELPARFANILQGEQIWLPGGAEACAENSSKN